MPPFVSPQTGVKRVMVCDGNDIEHRAMMGDEIQEFMNVCDTITGGRVNMQVGGAQARYIHEMSLSRLNILSTLTRPCETEVNSCKSF